MKQPLRVEILSQEEASARKQLDLDEEQHEIKSGDYWVERETGDVRLIRSLTVIDNILHSLKVMPHPSKRCNFDDSGHRRSQSTPSDYTLDEFLDKYTYIDQDEAKRIRESEIAGLNKEIADTSHELSLGYVEEGGINANNLLGTMATQVKSDMSLPISMAKDNTVQDVKGQIERTKEIAEKQGAFVKEKTAIIAKKSSEMALYYTEVGEQSLASIDGTLVFVEKLQQGVHTLNIFLGEGVSIVPLAEGEKASDDEPLTFYQRKLFLDEEWFYNLANGGADHNSLSEFREALKEDFGIIDTIAPSQKSVVLMQFRRNPKRREYPASSMAEAWANAQQDDADRTMFLLVRNGQSLYLIFSDDIEGGKRLFPTASEINELFKDREEGSKLFNGVEVDSYINFHDIRNAEARKTFDARARYYQRIILMLNGIHSRREDVFGKIRDEAYRDWLSLEFQQKHFRFVHDDEDALGHNFMPLAEFTKEKGKNIQAGSRIIGLWKNIADEDNAKGLFSNSIHYEDQQIWYPVHTLKPYIVEKSGSSLFVKIECKHRWNHDIKNKNFKVILDNRTLTHDSLCVDYIKAEEIDFYLNSRQARSQYVDYAELLIGARDMLRREEEESKPAVDHLFVHVKSAYPDLPEETIQEKLYEAISFWRIGKKGATLPDLTSSKNKKTLKEISDIFHSKTVGNKLNDIVEYATENKLDTIRISTDNKGKYFIYSVVSPEDRIDFGEYEKYPFVLKSSFELKDGKIIQIGSSQVTYMEETIGEEVLKTFKTYEMDSLLEKLDPNYIEGVKRIKTAIKEGEELLKILESGGGQADKLLRPLVEDRNDKQRRSRKRVILDYRVSIPMGVFLKGKIKDANGVYEWGNKKSIMVFEGVSTINRLVARYGSDELFDEVVHWIDDTYSTPTNTLSSLHRIRRGQEEAFDDSISEHPIDKGLLPSPRSKNGFFVNGSMYCGRSWVSDTSYLDTIPTIEKVIEDAKKDIEKDITPRNPSPREEIITLNKGY